MSLVTTTGLKVWPAASASVQVTSGAGNAVLGAWTELIPAAAIGSTIAIAGFCAEVDNVDQLEIQVGTGLPGQEVAISIPLACVVFGGNLAQKVLMLPVPIGNIGSGARVVLRTRTISAAVTYGFALLYYAGLPADQALLAPYNYAPYATGGLINGALVIPAASAWGSSGWSEFLPDTGIGLQVMGVGPQYPGSDYDGVEWEIDIGIGALGSEASVTTIPGTFAHVGIQGFTDTFLLAPYPVPDHSRVSYRLRKGSTSTTPLAVHLIYIQVPPVIPPPPPPPHEGCVPFYVGSALQGTMVTESVFFSMTGTRYDRDASWFDPTQDWTVVGWIQGIGSGPTSGEYRTFWIIGDFDYTGPALGLFADNANVVGVDYWNGMTDLVGATMPTVPGVWLPIAIIYRAAVTTLETWVARALTASVVVDLGAVTWAIRADHLGDDDFDSFSQLGLAYWGIWQRTFGADELNLQWSRTTVVDATGLLAFTPLVSPDPLDDISGNARNWTQTEDASFAPGPLVHSLPSGCVPGSLTRPLS